VRLATTTRKASISLPERDGDEVVNASATLKDVVSSYSYTDSNSNRASSAADPHS
jgi:hypothetical protein